MPNAPTIRLNLPDVEVFNGEFTSAYIRYETDVRDFRGNWGERGGSVDTKRDPQGATDIRIQDYTPKGMTITLGAAGEIRAHKWLKFHIDRRSWWVQLRGGVDGDYECLTAVEAAAMREQAMDDADSAD